MWYTRKGDKGDTYFFDTPKGVRVSKKEARVEALGALDELNSLLGVVKSKVRKVHKVLEKVQQNLFIIQAEVAGADKRLRSSAIKEMEAEIDTIERALPVIKSFLLPGESEPGALLDLARAVARRVERRVIEAVDSGAKISELSLVYLNRLSSLLYALAREANQRAGKKERAPTYL